MKKPKAYRFLWILGILMLQFGLAWAQDSTAWKIKQVNVQPQFEESLEKRIAKQLKPADDSLELKERIALLESKMGAKGWIAFAVDSFAYRDRNLDLKVFKGQQFFLDSILVDGINENTFEKSGLAKLNRKPGTLDLASVQEKMRFCLENYQDHGYPFAAFDSMQLAYSPADGDEVHAAIRYQFHPGSLVTIDSVIIKGKVREKSSFVQNLIGIYPGDAYDQSAIDRSRRLLNSSAYFRNAKQPEVVFISETKAKLILNMEPRKSGKFDLLLGILPPTDNTAKLQFTGLVDLQVVSPLFKAGEMVELRFDKLVGSSQKLHLRYAMPYMFGSPMGIDVDFSLLKQDTSFLNRTFKFAAPYAFSPSLSIKAYVKSKSSSLISVQRYERDSTLIPPVLDARDQTYGIGFQFESLDDRFSPTKGWRIKAEGGIGSKKVRKNARLSELVYEGVEFNLPKRETELRLEWYQRYTKRMVLLLANSTYWLDQKQYFQNDLLQVGGSRSLRGFNENQFFTNFYTMLTVENRFLLEERSYLFAFGDFAYLEDQTATVKVIRPFGVGLGLTYETKAGMLSVTYAAGQSANQSFAPSRGKIHIGLVNLF